MYYPESHSRLPIYKDLKLRREEEETDEKKTGRFIYTETMCEGWVRKGEARVRKAARGHLHCRLGARRMR